MILWLQFSQDDSFPRGANEIYPEYESRKASFPEMVIEKTIAFYLPLPSYFFVTPTDPELAERLESGLLMMLEDGALDYLFYQYHGDFIERANLKDRKIFTLENHYLSKETPFAEDRLWYKP